MALTSKIIISFIIIAVLLISSVYLVFFLEVENDDSVDEPDDEEPEITDISGDVSVGTGKTVTLWVTANDNIGVTSAEIYIDGGGIAMSYNEERSRWEYDYTAPSDDDTDHTYTVAVYDAESNSNSSSLYDIDVYDEDEEYVHTVFIEEGTETRCKSCPAVADIVHQTYESDDYHFYYVSLVNDVNNKEAEDCLENYNIFGFPTVFIDGGYKVIMGSDNFESLFKDKLSSAVSRKTPRLYLDITAEWNDSINELKTTVTVENKENETYTGHLKIYITEINSRWSDYSANPYHFGFLDYAINKPVEIKANENRTYSEKWDASGSDYPDVYPENLWVIAVIFSSESTQSYYDPPDNTQSFDAYYADAADAARVVEGSLPPTVGISLPKEGMRYILGKERRNTLFGNTVLIGRTTIKANVQAEVGVEKVEFSVKGRFREINETIYGEPYEMTWHKLAFGRYTITVTVYDNEGRTATDSMDVIAFML